MMNFEQIKARVQRQAAVAADAARSIRNFDQMAANDDYIHHDDLRTPEPKTRQEATPLRVSMSSICSGEPSESPPRSASTRATAAQALSQVTQFSSLVLPEDDDDFSDNEDGHIIQEEAQSKKKKNPNRFMDDLDERLARVEERNDQKTSLEVEAPTPTFQSPQQWSGWLKSPVMVNVLSTFQSPPAVRTANADDEKLPMLAAGPLSARRAAQEANSNYDDEDPMENHTIMTSSMLGASEQVELERIRLAAKADFLTMALNKLKKNKEFSFILLTLVLGSAAYFYSRHREEIDDVT